MIVSTGGTGAPGSKACTFEGPLLKRSVWVKQWNPRYFRLRGRTLCYYTTQGSKTARGEIPLVGAKVGRIEIPPGEKPKPFAIVVQCSTKKGRVDHYLAASSDGEREEWLKYMQKAIETTPKARLLNARNKTSTNRVENQATSLPSAAKQIEPGRSLAKNNVDTLTAVAPAPIPAPKSASIDSESGTSNRAKFYALSGDASDGEDGAEEATFDPDFVPPETPADADDPLSFLMSCNVAVEKKALQINKLSHKVHSPTMAKEISGKIVQKESAGGTSAAGISVSKPSNPPSTNTGIASMTRSASAAKASSKLDVSGMGLRTAVRGGDLNKVRAILTKNPSLATFTDNAQQSVLHVAALFKHEAIALILIDSGASILAKDNNGETPADVAPPSIANKMRAKALYHEKLNSGPGEDII